jgi:hypothetical protein
MTSHHVSQIILKKGRVVAILLLIYAASVVVEATLRATQSLPSEIQTSYESNSQQRLIINSQKSGNFLDDTVITTSHDKTLPPFGPCILNGYETCDDFKADVASVLLAIGKSIIEQNKNTSNICVTTYYYNDTTYGNMKSNNRRIEEETSFETSNQVPEVDEKDCIKSDGKYIFIGTENSIFVSDLDGRVVENITLPYPSTEANESTILTLDSIFVNANILTALVTVSISNEDEGTWNIYITAFIYRFYPKKKKLKLIKQFNISNGNYSDERFRARSIGQYIYAVPSSSYDPFFETLGPCQFQNVSATDYEQEALDYLHSNVMAYAQEVVTSALNNGAMTTCNNIIKLSREMIPTTYDYQTWPTLGITKVIAFGLSNTSLTSFNSSVYFFPYTYTGQGGIKPVVHFAKDSLLIAASSTTQRNYIVKFSLQDSVLTPTAVGIVNGSIDSEFNIDFHNGHYRIATNPNWLNYTLDQDSPRITILEEKNSQLEISGQVEDFDIGSMLLWVRFAADRGFVVTIYNEVTSLRVINLTSPTNPKIATTQLNSDLFKYSPDYTKHGSEYAQPLENGKFILTVTNLVTKENVAGIMVRMLQVTENSVYQMEQKAEVVLSDSVNSSFYASSDIFWDFHAIRYLSKAQKLIIPADVYKQNCSEFGCMSTTDPSKFDGFLVFDVDPANGITYIGNVTYDYDDCYLLPPRSMVFNGDLITTKGSTVKRTSNISTLSILEWETNYCR